MRRLSFIGLCGWRAFALWVIPFFSCAAAAQPIILVDAPEGTPSPVVDCAGGDIESCDTALSQRLSPAVRAKVLADRKRAVADREARMKRAAAAEASRKAEEERQRAAEAARQATEARRSADEAKAKGKVEEQEDKKKADEADRQRQAMLKAEEDRKRQEATNRTPVPLKPSGDELDKTDGATPKPKLPVFTVEPKTGLLALAMLFSGIFYLLGLRIDAGTTTRVLIKRTLIISPLLIIGTAVLVWLGVINEITLMQVTVAGVLIITVSVLAFAS